MCVCVSVRVCVCVSERDSLCVCVCVCVWYGASPAVSPVCPDVRLSRECDRFRTLQILSSSLHDNAINRPISCDFGWRVGVWKGTHIWPDPVQTGVLLREGIPTLIGSSEKFYHCHWLQESSQYSHWLLGVIMGRINLSVVILTDLM